MGAGLAIGGRRRTQGRAIAALALGLVATGLSLCAPALPGLGVLAAEPAAASAPIGGPLREARSLVAFGANSALMWGYTEGADYDPMLAATTDGGTTWSARAIPKAGGPFSVSDVSFASATNGWNLQMDGMGDQGFKLQRTTDGGVTWTTKTLPVSSPDKLTAVSDQVVLVVGQDSGGDLRIYRSANGGDSWTSTASPTYIIDGFEFVDANTGYLHGNNSGSTQRQVFKTTDGGVSWTRAGDPPNAVPSFWGKLIAGPSGRVAFMTEHKVSTSTDGGATWGPERFLPDNWKPLAGDWAGTRLVMGARLLQECSDPDTGRTVPDGAIFTSDDAGATWTKRSPGAAFGDGVDLMSASGATVWAGANKRGGNDQGEGAAPAIVVQRSTDSGVTWGMTYPAGIPGAELEDVRAWSATDVTVSSANGLARTTDGGGTWTFRYGPDGGPKASHMADALHGRALCQQTADGGQTWTHVDPQPDPTMVTQTHGYRVLEDAGGGYSHAYRTTNGAETWSPIGAPAYAAEVTRDSNVEAIDAQHMWLAGNDADDTPAIRVYRSSDFGTTWDGNAVLPWPRGWDLFSTEFTFTVADIEFANASNGWVLLSGATYEDRHPYLATLYRTTDGGATWSTVTLPSGVMASNYTEVHLDTFGTSGVAMWAGGYQTVGRLAISTDGGGTWTKRQLADGLFVRGVDVWDASTAWVVGQLPGVIRQPSVAMKTTNGGATWTTTIGNSTPAVTAGEPGWPEHVDAVAAPGGATVTWDGTAFPAGGTIDKYRIWMHDADRNAFEYWCRGVYDDGNYPGQGGCAPPIEVDATKRSVFFDMGEDPRGSFSVQTHTPQGGWSRSSPSTEIVTKGTLAKPGAPTNVQATAGNGTANVTWSAPTSGGAVAEYHVKVDPANASSQTDFTVPGGADARSFQVTGLANGNPHDIWVYARNGAGDSPLSTKVTVTPMASAVAPGAPTNVQATAGNGQAQVSWTKPASEGSSPITGYKVTPFIGAAAQTTVTFNSTALTQAVTGLTNGTTYTFKVAAFSSPSLVGPQSAASNAVTPMASAVAPGAPTNVQATAGNGSAQVSWTKPASEGSSPITGYKVTPFIGAAAQTTVTFASTALTQQITGLTNGTTYTFKVAAFSTPSLVGPRSAASNAVTPQPPAPVEGAVYVPVTPCRVVDTRNTSGPLGTRSFVVAGSGSAIGAQGGKAGGCGVPTSAVAVEASVTAVAPGEGGFLRAYPSDQAQPTATFLNYAKGQGITNTGTLTLASSGASDLSVFASGSTNVVIDVQGYFIDPEVQAGAVYVPVTPCRVVDTRNTGGPLGTRSFVVAGAGSAIGAQGGEAGGCGIPTAAVAVEASVTAVAPGAGGFLRAFPSDQAQPTATFLNYAKGQGITNTGTLSLAATGANDLSVFASGSTNVVIDVQGYFIDPEVQAGAVYVPVTPCRVVDTRNTSGPLGTRSFVVAGAGSAIAAQGGKAGGCGVPTSAVAVEASVTAVAPGAGGFLRAYPSDQTQPTATFLNYAQGQGITNTGTLSLASSGANDLSVFASGSTNVVIDVQGYFTATG